MGGTLVASLGRIIAKVGNIFANLGKELASDGRVSPPSGATDATLSQDVFAVGLSIPAITKDFAGLTDVLPISLCARRPVRTGFEPHAADAAMPGHSVSSANASRIWAALTRT